MYNLMYDLCMHREMITTIKLISIPMTSHDSTCVCVCVCVCRDFPGSLVVKTLPFNAGGKGLILGQGAKIPHASRPENQNIKQKQYCNKFNKDFKNGPHQKTNL